LSSAGSGRSSKWVWPSSPEYIRTIMRVLLSTEKSSCTQSGTVALPAVDSLQRSSHQRCLVALRQAVGVAERRDALLIGQHADRPCPVGAPHATLQPKRIDDPQYRLPDIV